MHALVLFVLLAATPQRPIEMVGHGKLPAGFANDVRNAATVAGVDVVALELIEDGFVPIVLAYGPMTARPNGICRGPVHGIDDEDSKRMKIASFGEGLHEITYAVEARACPKSVQSRIVIEGATSDSELAAILKTLRERRVARHPDGTPISIHIGKNLLVDWVKHQKHDEATIVMVDRANRKETLNVLLVKIDGTWLIWHAAPGAAFGL